MQLSTQTLSILSLSSILCASSFAHSLGAPKKIPILSDPFLLGVAKIVSLNTQDDIKVSYAEVTPDELSRLQNVAHDYHRCGGFERLNSAADAEAKFSTLRAQKVTSLKFSKLGQSLGLEKREMIEKAVSKVNEADLVSFVTWFSSYPTRFNKNSTANTPVNALKDKIAALITSATPSWVATHVSVSSLSHRATPQNSLRLHIEGSTRPNEIVALGAHLDSISWNGQAPGADDNASGSSNIFETAQILLSQVNPPERSIDFFWYAGEESGLLGSAEIAKTYKTEKKDVIGVLQLDMTLFAGEGEGTIGSMTDFTSPWLREVLLELNQLYVGAKFVSDQCGYGCSDHASWFSQGYPTVMPFEAAFDTMNHNLHTSHDQIDGQSNFKHSAYFSRLAVSFAMELGNSTIRQP